MWYIKTMFSKLGEFRDGIYLLNAPEMPVYLVKGRKNYLIDSAFTFMGGRILEHLGELDTEPHYLLLTHSHYDHIGAAPVLKKAFPGMKIVASARTAEILRKPKAIELIKKLEEEAERVFGEASEEEFEAFGVDITLSEGEGLEDFSVLETPGHTKCSISFVFPEKEIIFVGDAAGVMEDGYIRPQFLSSYSQYVASLKKIMKYSHFSLALGHGGIFPEGEDFLKRSLERTVDFRKEILELYGKFRDQERVAEKIYEREYKGLGLLQPEQAYMINLRAMIKAVLREEEG